MWKEIRNFLWTIMIRAINTADNWKNEVVMEKNLTNNTEKV
jgi:hypothetical protein